MHELSLCEGIRQAIEEQAHIHGFARVTLVRLEVGRFAGVELAALAFAFDVAMQASVAEGARLEVVALPGRAACFDCGETVLLENRLDPCPHCGGGRLLPIDGEEMRLKELEVS